MINRVEAAIFAAMERRRDDEKSARVAADAAAAAAIAAEAAAVAAKKAEEEAAAAAKKAEEEAKVAANNQTIVDLERRIGEFQTQAIGLENEINRLDFQRQQFETNRNNTRLRIDYLTRELIPQDGGGLDPERQ